MAEPFRFERRARGPRSLALIAVAAGVLLFLLLVVDAAPWVVAVLALFVIPAIADAIRDARATLALDGDTLTWTSGRRHRTVPLDRIAEVRLATTLDFSQRATILLTTGETLRIPPECLPGGRLLDEALAARGIAHRRSLFGF